MTAFRLILGLALLAAGCGTAPPPPDPYRVGEPVARAPAGGQPRDLPPPAPAPGAPSGGTGALSSPTPLPAPAPAPGTAPISPASQALLAESRGHLARGDPGQAAATLERALRIDPRQPLLWLELAEIRLAEGELAQAESLAQKALTFTAGQPELERRAESVLRRARAGLGG